MVIPVNLKNGSYDIHISRDSLQVLGHELTQRKGRYFIVADKLAYKYHSGKLHEAIGREHAGIITVHGEEEKNLSTVIKVLESAAMAGINRGDCFIAFGGGVCGDIAGFAAAIFMRGIDYYQVPTTLLSQVDSSVGGKTGVDLKAGKNLAGCFKQPSGVYINTELLKTLGPGEIRQGKSEMIKAAAIHDELLFNSFENSMCIDEDTIGKCVRIKLAYVMGDELDTGKRMILNFGHTIAHGLEKVKGFGVISHGDAVSIGMAVSVQLSEKAGITEKGTAKRLIKLLKSQGLPVSTELTMKELGQAMILDKKMNKGLLKAVFIEKIGKGIIKEMTLDEFIGMGDSK
ncbi:MAG: 3-dehydroquinate synthase [Clostridia bacterium]|nr:3-dehydroquinate synthase [Clostridia bacterium]MBN2882352.1 3-dehydroquinate synthase [Clostridia bacterium]